MGGDNMFTTRLAGLLLGCLIFQAVVVSSNGRVNRSRLLIVGAGVSGLGAASRLLEKGFSDFRILEAENRIGGRVYSVPFGEGVVLDYGSDGIEGGEENPLYGLLADLVEDIGEYEEPLSVFSDGEARRVTLDYNSLDLEGRHNTSFKEVLFNRSREVVNGSLEGEKSVAFMDHTAKVQCTYEGCEDLGDVSASLYYDYYDFNNTRSYGFKGRGCGVLIDAILRKTPKSNGPPHELGDRLLLKTVVKKIKVLDSGEVAVECTDGSVHLADLVLVTVSAGVLKHNMDSLFQPPLPPLKRAAIKAVGFGTVDKIMIRFPRAWWPANYPGFQFIWLKRDKNNYRGEYSWETEILEFATEKRSPNTLTAWMVGEPARQMERTPLDGVKRASMRLLRYFLGANYTIPEPVEVLRSTWGTNPHFRGSYSYRSMEAERHNVSHITTPLAHKDGKEVVFFAGEATSPHYYSSLHGALESGWREAERILGRLTATS